MGPTPFATWFAFAPLWEIALVIFAGMIGFAAIGSWLRKRHTREDGGSSPAGDSQEGFMVSAVMGLLALLIGFTFSLAIDRFDARRERVLTEANAIGTTYLRTQLLEQPHRARISKLLIDYTDNRVALAQEERGPRQTQLVANNDRLLTDLWTATIAAWPSVIHYDFSSAYIDSMNQLIDMDAERKAGRAAHVPAEVLLVLFACQFIAAGVIAYVLVGRRGRQSAALLFLLFGVSLLLIIDIDQPVTGGISESQQPMLDLQASLKSKPSSVYDRFDAPAPVPANPSAP